MSIVAQAEDECLTEVFLRQNAFVTGRFIRQVMNLDGFGEGPGGTDELAIGVEGKGKAVEYQFVVSHRIDVCNRAVNLAGHTGEQLDAQTLLARVPRTAERLIRKSGFSLAISSSGSVVNLLQVPNALADGHAMLFPLYSIINVELPGAK